MRRIIVLFAIALLFINTSAQAEPNKEIKSFLDSSGLTSQVNDIPTIVTAELERVRHQLHPKQYREFVDTLNHVFTPENILEHISNALSAPANTENLRAWNALNTSPVAKRLYSLKSKIDAVETSHGIRQFLGDLHGNMPEFSRMKLLSELDDATHSSETSLDMQITTFKGIGKLLLATGQGHIVNTDELDQLLETMRGKLAPRIKQLTMLTTMYLYRDVEDSELQSFVNFYQDKSAQAAMNLRNNALVNAIEALSQDALKRANVLPPRGINSI